MDSSLSQAIQQICDEKGISLESVVETIEAALAAAYRKDYGAKNQNIKVKFDISTGKFNVYDEKKVVDKPVVENAEETEINNEIVDKNLRFNPKTEIQIEDARKIKEDAKIDDIIITPLETHSEFGRMASQTAKQVIIQKLREAERETLHNEFKKKEKEVLIGVIQRKEGRNWLVDFGKITGILPQNEAIPSEEYRIGAKFKFYILSVEQGAKGPEIIVSRAHPEILKKLFILEIPEISSDMVEIKALSREAGSRTKIAVMAKDSSIDPIGACVGQRGARIQTIINELGGEKVDIIEYKDNTEGFIANALSPAKVMNVTIDKQEHLARVIVNEDQLSLAIGKAGQNVRLAAKLTGWKINIKSTSGEEFASGAEEAKDQDDSAKKEKNGGQHERKNKKEENQRKRQPN